MLIETVELNLSNNGLGPLTAEKLLNLFADVQAHVLTEKLPHSLADIVDIDLQPLYPGYVWLKLDIPDGQRLAQFKPWQKVDLATQVHRFGSTMLESEYLIAPHGQIKATDFTADNWPSMQAVSVFIRSDDVPSAPAPKQLATLPNCSEVPNGLSRIKVLQKKMAANERLINAKDFTSVDYPLYLNRDVACHKNLMFSSYVMALNVAEQQVLQSGQTNGQLQALLPHLHLSNLEVAYTGHAAFPDELAIAIDLNYQANSARSITNGMVALGQLSTHAIIYNKNTEQPLTHLQTTKVLQVPHGQTNEFKSAMSQWQKINRIEQ